MTDFRDLLKRELETIERTGDLETGIGKILHIAYKMGMEDAIKPKSIAEVIIHTLLSTCKSYEKCKGCPMAEMDVMIHGDYVYDCPLEAVIDAFKEMV